jgi:hypothetical protein
MRSMHGALTGANPDGPPARRTTAYSCVLEVEGGQLCSMPCRRPTCLAVEVPDPHDECARRESALLPPSGIGYVSVCPHCDESSYDEASGICEECGYEGFP